MTDLTVLVLSDSHWDVASMVQITEAVRPDRIVHLGDHLSDGETLRCAYPDLPFVGVPGNCDGWTSAPEERLITLEGRRLLLGHGHHWGATCSRRPRPP